MKPKAIEVVDHFFRHEHGKMIASFISKFGFTNLEIIEDAIQDALIKAMQVWPFHDVPKNPSAWIFRVANNRLIDKLRREKKVSNLDVLDNAWEDTIDFQMPEEEEIEDDQLKMIFTCCHPSLPEETQIILTLNLLCGLGTEEIARALMKNKEAIAKALTRGKRKFKTEVGSLQPPGIEETKRRLQVVMKVIYLLFNEGYKVTKGVQLMDLPLSTESIRLGMLLLTRFASNHELNALMALMYFQISRFKARCDSNGHLISMQDQDRSLWDQELISIGHQYLSASAGSASLHEYQIQAGIAALHCNAENFEKTDWTEMLRLYDLQVSYNRLPIAEMNRVIPLTKVKGLESGLAEINRLSKYPQLLKNHIYYAIKAELLEASGKHPASIKALRLSLNYVTNETEQIFLEKKLEHIMHDVKN